MVEPTPAAFPQLLFQPGPGACQVLLVRHGQSSPYVTGLPFPLVDGHGDPPLTALGHHQAELAAQRLAGEPITAIYVSSLTRTQQTAAPLAARLGLTPTVEPDLREVFLGEGEGGHFRQMSAENHPAVLAMRAQREWGVIPGAETNQQLEARTVGAVELIAQRHPDQMVAVFCHGGVIAAIVGHAIGVGPFIFHGSRHTGISHLVVNPPHVDERWIVRSFNDGGHAGTLAADHPVPEEGGALA